MNWMHWVRPRLWTLLAMGTLLVALVFTFLSRRAFDHQQYLDLSLFDGADRFEQVLKSPPAFAAYRTASGAQELLGYVAFGAGPGYAGSIATRTLISPAGHIIAAEVLEHTETPGYIRAVLASDFLRRLRGKELADAFMVGQDLDGVTKATISSRGIAQGVRQASHAMGREEFGLTIPEPKIPVNIGLKEIVLTALLLLTVIGTQLRIPRLRWFVQIGSILFVGFWFNSTISLANVGGLLLGFVPPWRQNLWWYIWVLGIPLFTLVRGQSINCTWLCPFGATQELLAKVGGGQIRCRPEYEKRLRRVRFGLAWLAMLLVFLVGSPGVAGYEPFGTLFGFQGLVVHWITLVVILVGALFVRRLWCSFLCPVGVMDELTWKLGRRIRGLLKGRLDGGETEPKAGGTPV